MEPQAAHSAPTARSFTPIRWLIWSAALATLATDLFLYSNQLPAILNVALLAVSRDLMAFLWSTEFGRRGIIFLLASIFLYYFVLSAGALLPLTTRKKRWRISLVFVSLVFIALLVARNLYLFSR